MRWLLHWRPWNLINYWRIERQAGALARQFQSAEPFRYVCMDDFISRRVSRKLNRGVDAVMKRMDKDPDVAKKHRHVLRKIGVQKTAAMEDCHRQLFEELQSPRFLALVEKITGIQPLYADMDLVGGGLHEIYPGGYLNVHTDFNFHPKSGKHRRLNIIVYLNEDWRDEWEGHLELWNEGNTECFAKIAPLAGRMALFETSEISFHGHPEPLACPEGVTRRSIAAYYYSEWPNGLPQRDRTNYRLTPKQVAQLTAEIRRRKKQGMDKLDVLEELSNSYQRSDVKAVLATAWGKPAPAPVPEQSEQQAE